MIRLVVIVNFFSGMFFGQITTTILGARALTVTDYCLILVPQIPVTVMGLLGILIGSKYGRFLFMSFRDFIILSIVSYGIGLGIGVWAAV